MMRNADKMLGMCLTWPGSGIVNVKIATFRHISKEGSFVSSSNIAFLEDETFKMCISSSFKEGCFKDYKA